MTTINQKPCADACNISFCRLKCSLEIVDTLLSMPDAVTGDEVDLLLDFRSLLRARTDAEATLRLFCDLRRRLEQRHYLTFYRLRRWLENQMAAEVSSEQSGNTTRVPLRLDYYCVEAVRRQCLCTAIQKGTMGETLRLGFRFLALPPPRFPHVINDLDLARV